MNDHQRQLFLFFTYVMQGNIAIAWQKRVPNFAKIISVVYKVKHRHTAWEYKKLLAELARYQQPTNCALTINLLKIN